MSGVGAAFSFAPRFGFLRKPPVDNSGLLGEFNDIRDVGLDASVCAGEMSLEGGDGGSKTGSGRGEAVRDTRGFSTTRFAG